MARDLFNRYVWLVDLLTRYERLTRRQINDHWLRSPLSEGRPIPERTFFHFRRAIEENFGIEIACNSFDEYYLKMSGNEQNNKAFTNWILDSYAVRGAISETPQAMERVIVEDVPSARLYLSPVLEAIRDKHSIRFNYTGFNRSREERNIIYSPYFVKLYRQRWYMVGMNEKKGEIRTYALDRITKLVNTEQSFEMPEDFVPANFFDNILGITTSKAAVRRVELRVAPGQAKYFRALPLHETQREESVDVGGYCVFSYQLKLNYELVHEILSYGSQVQVLAPKELIAMVKDELSKMNGFYEKKK